MYIPCILFVSYYTLIKYLLLSLLKNCSTLSLMLLYCICLFIIVVQINQYFVIKFVLFSLFSLYISFDYKKSTIGHKYTPFISRFCPVHLHESSNSILTSLMADFLRCIDTIQIQIGTYPYYRRMTGRNIQKCTCPRAAMDLWVASSCGRHF